MGCYSVASVPKSGSVGACWSLPGEKINSFVFFASLCVIICLPEEGTLLCLLSTIDSSAEQRQASSMGSAHRKECKRMAWHVPSELPMATQGWHLGDPFGHSFLTCSPGAPFSVTVGLLFPTYNHLFSGEIHSLFLLPSLTFPPMWWLFKLRSLTHLH